jgi:hypothetical protein
MTLRPFKTIRQYQQLVEALNTIIEQHKTLHDRHQQIITLKEQETAFLKELVHRQAETITEMRTPGPLTPMPLPDVHAVEGLVGAFFDAESVIIAREALELTRNLTPLGPNDVMATQRCLMKLWRTYAMRKLEQTAKQDVL